MVLPKPYYDDGKGIVIYNADCRDVLPQLEKVDLVLTDPPYGVDIAEWDATIIPTEDWLPLVRCLSPTVLVTPGNGNQWYYPKPDWEAAWFRPGSVQRVRKGTGFSHWEPILIYGNNVMPFDAKMFPANQERIIGHPCPKPIKLFRWLITSHPQAKTILDSFMGSGTTLRAAKDLGRQAIGIEIEEKYCEIAAKRLSQEVMPLC